MYNIPSILLQTPQLQARGDAPPAGGTNPSLNPPDIAPLGGKYSSLKQYMLNALLLCSSVQQLGFTKNYGYTVAASYNYPCTCN